MARPKAKGPRTEARMAEAKWRSWEGDSQPTFLQFCAECTIKT